jgi:hypothetical protein
VGQFELCAGCSSFCVVWLLTFVQQKVRWTVVAAVSCCCVVEELGGGNKTQLVLDIDVPRLMCISNPNLTK